MKFALISGENKNIFLRKQTRKDNRLLHRIFMPLEMHDNKGLMHYKASISAKIISRRHKMHLQRFLLVILVITLTEMRSTNLKAQGTWKAEAVPVNITSFNESLDPLPDVSGSPLVGLRLGEASGNVDTNNINLVIPPSTTSNFCIIGNTKDGRYSSENPYTIKIVDNDATTVRVRPFTNKSQKALEQYPLEELAIRAFQSPTGDCYAANAIQLPQVVSPSNKTDSLYAMINSGSRITNGLLSYSSSVPVVASCITIGGKSSLSFDTICRFSSLQLPTKAEGTLTLSFDDGFGEESHHFKIQLPQNK